MTPPIRSRFTAEASAQEVLQGIDLSGRRAIVTGATSGVGLETARALAGAGAEVVMGARDAAAGEALAQEINTEVGASRVRSVPLELGRLRSVRDFATAFGDLPLHFLFNNAGVMATPHGHTEDGFETQVGVNHFGHFLLTKLLAPNLVAAAPARVVVVSSGAHHMGDIDYEDMHYRRRPYDPYGAYAQSKTANNLFTAGFQSRFGPLGVTANAVTPGAVLSNLGRHTTIEGARRMGWVDENDQPRDMAFKSPAQGAATSVWAATAQELSGIGGLYLEDCQAAKEWTAEKPNLGYTPRSFDPVSADRLWAHSELATRESHLV